MGFVSFIAKGFLERKETRNPWRAEVGLCVLSCFATSLRKFTLHVCSQEQWQSFRNGRYTAVPKIAFYVYVSGSQSQVLVLHCRKLQLCLLPTHPPHCWLPEKKENPHTIKTVLPTIDPVEMKSKEFCHSEDILPIQRMLKLNPPNSHNISRRFFSLFSLFYSGAAHLHIVCCKHKRVLFSTRV